LAIEVRRRDGNEYYYYKVTGGKSIYLGTLRKPHKEGIDKAYKIFKARKDKLTEEEQVFQALLAAIEKKE
jgi:hypothetical protein